MAKKKTVADTVEKTKKPTAKNKTSKPKAQKAKPKPKAQKAKPKPKAKTGLPTEVPKGKGSRTAANVDGKNVPKKKVIVSKGRSGAKPQASATPEGKVTRPPQKITTTRSASNPKNLPAKLPTPKATPIPEAPIRQAQKLLPAPKPKPTMPTGAPKYPIKTPSALGGISSGLAIAQAGELAHEITPEGVGTKAGHQYETVIDETKMDPKTGQMGKRTRGAFIEGSDDESLQQSPRYYGGGAGGGAVIGGLKKFTSDLGNVVGDVENFFEVPGDGSWWGNNDPYGVMGEEAFKARENEQNLSIFGGTTEEQAYKASGGERPPERRPVLSEPPMMRSSTDESVYGLSKNKSPIEIGGGNVTANPRYGMPSAPDMQRRSLAERFGDVTGGAIPDSMEGFMVANFLQNQLRMDDNARVGDNKDIYEADLSGIPAYMSEDRLSLEQPAKIRGLEASANANNSIASRTSAINRLREADILYREAQTNAVMTKDQNELLELRKQAMVSATKYVADTIKNNPRLTNLTPEETKEMVLEMQLEIFQQAMPAKFKTDGAIGAAPGA